MKAFFDSGPEMVEYIEKHTMVKFQGVPLPDYHTEKPGASSGRSIVTVAFSGRHLKRQIRKIRYTLKGFSALGSMQANLADLSKLTAPFSSVSNFLFGARKALRFGMDLLKYGKGAEMAHGNALVGRLVSSVQNRGVEFWRNGPAIAPILKDGVDGLVVSSAGQDIRMKARRGVILASGSIGRSPSGQKPVPHEWSAVPKNIQGDGISLAVQAETHTPPPNQGNAIFALISLLRRPDGTTWRYPHFSLDRAKPGSLVVGPNGKRFVNESAPYHEFVKPMRGVSTEPLSFATKTFCENMAWV
jgi:hypothetical protein